MTIFFQILNQIIKPILLLLIFAAGVIACKKKKEEPSQEPEPIPVNAPMVKSDSTYAIIEQRDIEYGQGLSHQGVGSGDSTTISLKLDVYQPNNTLTNRPAYFFIHGGGFTSGSKRQLQIRELASYYTSRGWVFISIDYRIKNDRGTLPQAWIDYADTLTGVDPDQFMAMYPAHRDAKVAMRWLIANAETYHINTNFITVGGGSAGAVMAITLGISAAEDYRDELNITQDPTHSSTHLNQTYKVKTIIDYWGSKVGLDAIQLIYGHYRFNANNPPLFIAHGTDDPLVDYSGAEELKSLYETNNIPLAFYRFEGAGHGIWYHKVDRKSLSELAFEFIIEQQQLKVE